MHTISMNENTQCDFPGCTTPANATLDYDGIDIPLCTAHVGPQWSEK